MTHRAVQSTLWNGIGPRDKCQWGRRRRRRSNVHGSLLHKRDCASAWRGVSPIHEPWNSNRPLRETRQWIQGYVTKDGYEWTAANPSEEIIISPGVANTRQQEDASEMLEEYDDGHAMEWSCVYGSRTSWRVQESGLHATRAGLWRAPVKSWIDPYVDWCGKCAGWSQERMVSNVEPPTARGRAASDPATRRLEGKAGECRTLGSLARSINTWAIQCQWRGSQQYHMLVKTFSVQALETVRSSPEGVNAEVWRKQTRNTNLALVSDMTWYFDLCWKDDLVNMMSGTWVVRSTRSERRGCHRVSSEVFLANNDPVKNLNKELCGLVRCYQVASKTSPGSRSPEVSSVRQSRVEPRAWRNSTTSTSGDCQRARCCAKRSSIPSWTRRAWKDPNSMQGMQCMWSPVRKDKAMTKRWSPVTVWQLFCCCCCCCVGCCVCCRCVLVLRGLLLPLLLPLLRSSCSPPPFSLHLKDYNPAPSNNLASIWHSQKYRTRVSAQFRFYTHINMVFTSYLIYITFNVP